MRATRTERYKLIVNFEVSTRVDVPSDVRQSPIYPLMHQQFDVVREPAELYDLVEDPWERHNLAGCARWRHSRPTCASAFSTGCGPRTIPCSRVRSASPYYAHAVSWLTGC